MKRVMSLFSLVGGGVAIVLSALLQTGCEEAKGLEGLQVDVSPRYVAKAGDMVEILVIGKRVDTPNFDSIQTTTSVSNNTTTTTTIQRGGIFFSYEYDLLSLPFVWQVEDGSLGTLREVATGYVRYTATSAARANVVIVRDQYDNKAEIVILPTPNPDASYSLTLTASKTSVSVNEAVTITVSTATAQAPFSWRRISGEGVLSASTGASAGYSSTKPEVAVIEATDANGASGVIAITVTDAASGDGGSDGGPGGTDP